MKYARVICLSAAAAVASACTAAEDPTELTMNIRVSERNIEVFARETARPCRCSTGEWPALGACLGWSDALSCECDPAPATCIERLRLVRGGVTVLDDPVATQFGLTLTASADQINDDDVLEVVGCGGVAQIPLGNDPLPVPTVSVTTENSDSDVVLAWAIVPESASVLTIISDGFVMDVCHGVGASGTKSHPAPPASERLQYLVHAFAPARTHQTDLGSATVWRGGVATTSFDGDSL